MNTDEVFGLIEEIGNTPGKNDKIAMLKACASSDTLKKALQMAYDPTISYGIRAVPNRSSLTAAGELFNEQTWMMLAQMRDRTLTGSAMLAAVAHELDRLSQPSADLFKRIMLKDMRAGFSEETCNKVWSGLVPDFPYMRCSLPAKAKFADWNIETEGAISQEKQDGMFLNVDHETTGAVFIYSRQGSMFPMEKFEELATAIRTTLTPGTQSHGECLVQRDGVVLAREVGNGVLNSVLKGGDFAPNEKPVFVMWDQIPLSAVKPKGKYEVGYKKRLVGIIAQLRANTTPLITLTETKFVKSLREAYQHCAEVLARGGEGTIIKRVTAFWKDGTSVEQIKLKLEFEVDLEVQGVVSGKLNGKNAGRAGSLACASKCGGLQVDVAIKGEAMRDAVDANPTEWVGKIMPVTANLILKPGDSNPLHSLFLPRFSQSTYRLDKTIADTLSRAFEIEEAAKEGAANIDALKEAA
jgi:DNA ligase-1